jgi:hypothetical protein
MRISLVAALVLGLSVAGCSSVSTNTTPMIMTANAASSTLPNFGQTGSVSLNESERNIAIRDAKARYNDPRRPLTTVAAVQDKKTGVKYACVNFWGKKAQGGDPLPVTVAGQFSCTSFAILAVGTPTNNRATAWETCNRLGVNIDWRPYE